MFLPTGASMRDKPWRGTAKWDESMKRLAEAVKKHPDFDPRLPQKIDPLKQMGYDREWK